MRVDLLTMRELRLTFGFISEGVGGRWIVMDGDAGVLIGGGSGGCTSPRDGCVPLKKLHNNNNK